MDYKQGFRDALLTLKAELVRSQLEWGRDDYSNLDSQVLNAVESKLDELLAQENHDLWNLLALARTDLSRHPEAESLRLLLRAPNGLLIDSRGRVLFVRLAGADYDTGVLGVLDENAQLRGALDAAEDGSHLLNRCGQ